MSTRSRGLPAACCLCVLVGSASAASPVWSTEYGQGLTGSYVADLQMHDGDLYATGQFTITGVPGGSHIARWDGSAWAAVGDGLQNQYSNAMASFQGDLIVGGYFDTAGNVPGTAKLARWDGSAWHSMDAQAEIFLSSIWDLEVHDDGSGEALYVAGNYVNLNGQTGLDHIARWDGEAYTPVGGTIGGAVPLIVLDVLSADIGDGQHLYAAGRFLSIDDVPANNIARWNGESWEALGAGIRRTSGFAQGFHMTVFDDGSGPALFVGGSFNLINNTEPAANVAKWDGSAWTTVGAGFDGAVQELAVYDDGTGEALYAMGNFNNSGATPTARIAKWNGTAWQPVGDGANGNVFTALVHDDELILGGGFTQVDNQPASLVVSLVGSCQADLSGDGQVDIFDLLGYVDFYANADPAADFAAPFGTIDLFDLLAFIDAYTAGCP